MCNTISINQQTKVETATAYDHSYVFNQIPVLKSILTEEII